ncbi:MAG: YraN family protein [[Clostridium] scindens]
MRFWSIIPDAGTGEIDIIARDGEYLVFCEVKYRPAQARDPAEAVDERKQRRIISGCAPPLSDR